MTNSREEKNAIFAYIHIHEPSLGEVPFAY